MYFFDENVEVFWDIGFEGIVVMDDCFVDFGLVCYVV